MTRQLQPILYHYFSRPVPYAQTWALQDRIHQLQLHLRQSSSTHPDVLLLLQHRPTYTAGRRQTDLSIQDDRTRLQSIGADFVTTTRGGQLTYHGPGQLVGYPLIDLSRYTPTIGARDYVCRIQKLLQTHLLKAHAIQHFPSEHTGVLLDPTNKIASIGVQIRHRLTSHGFALNLTTEPLSWFDQIVACGLIDVKAVSVETKLQKPVDVNKEVSGIIETFGDIFNRRMVRLDLEAGGEIEQAILALEKDAEQGRDWPVAPRAVV
ncbi:chloroplast lipoate protein ligase [Phlegmacium glaucopus]|nr:chloroplast lipoate protein ligase [Phlegmacium glaucopus]